MEFLRTDRFRPTCALRPSGTPTCPTLPLSEKTAVNTVSDPTSLAMVYSPRQPWQNLYDPMKALSRGTLFADLDKPFAPPMRQERY